VSGIAYACGSIEKCCTFHTSAAGSVGINTDVLAAALPHLPFSHSDNWLTAALKPFSSGLQRQLIKLLETLENPTTSPNLPSKTSLRSNRDVTNIPHQHSQNESRCGVFSRHAARRACKIDVDAVVAGASGGIGQVCPFQLLQDH